MSKQWAPSNLHNAEYIGILEIEDNGEFTVMLSSDKKYLIFGGACNTGFLESGYIRLLEYESLDECLQELNDDLTAYYDRKGHNRIICNDRM
jgi:hypothetical protein